MYNPGEKHQWLRFLLVFWCRAKKSKVIISLEISNQTIPKCTFFQPEKQRKKQA